MSNADQVPINDSELKSAYEKLYGRPLTTEEIAHIRFNFVRYIELLILLDHQHKDWLEQHQIPGVNDKQ